MITANRIAYEVMKCLGNIENPTSSSIDTAIHNIVDRLGETLDDKIIQDAKDKLIETHLRVKRNDNDVVLT